MKKIFFSLIIVLLSCSLTWGASSYYVDNSVGASGNGTSGSPWKNLSNINWTTVGAASKPCTIYISGGATSQTYAENLGGSASGSGVGTEVIIKRPTSAEWSGHSGIVYMRPAGGDWTELSGNSYMIFDGLDIQTQDAAGNAKGFFIRDGAHHITVRNCTIVGNRGAGVAFYSAHDNTVQNNILGPPDGTNGDDPCGGNGDNNTIEYNIITGGWPSNTDIHFDAYQVGSSSTSLGLIFRYNIIREHNSAGIAVYCGGSDNGTGENVSMYVYGNIFEFTDNNGSNAGTMPAMVLCGGGTNAFWVKAYIYNNIFVNHTYPNQGGGGLGISYSGNSVSGNVIDIRNNIFYNSLVDVSGTGTRTLNNNIYYTTVSGGDVIGWNASYYTMAQFGTYKTASGQDANSLATDPLLTSVSGTLSTAHDLRPTASSPGNNVGVVLGSPYNYGLTSADVKASWPLSVVIAARGATYDIGPYEYVQSITLTAPTGLRLSN